MKAVTVTQSFTGSVSELESRWYDTGGWGSWVDGFDRIVETCGDWPRAGAIVTWQSGPAGRGRVTERVLVYEPQAGQTVDVEDDSITGRQRVVFKPALDGVEVTLSLEYQIKRPSFFTPLIDILFIRRAMAASLEATLNRFGAELPTAAR
mgnify:CR=1 FL=1